MSCQKTGRGAVYVWCCLPNTGFIFQKPVIKYLRGRTRLRQYGERYLFVLLSHCRASFLKHSRYPMNPGRQPGAPLPSSFPSGLPRSGGKTEHWWGYSEEPLTPGPHSTPGRARWGIQTSAAHLALNCSLPTSLTSPSLPGSPRPPVSHVTLPNNSDSKQMSPCVSWSEQRSAGLQLLEVWGQPYSLCPRLDLHLSQA